MTKKATYIPTMGHYLKLKEQHEDAIISYRLGDFYETFFEDAKAVSSELDLVLTGRNVDVEERVLMRGIPHHAAEGYIQRLIQKGYKVATVEQLEDPALAKGLVKRDVIKIVTSGTIMDEVSDEKTTVYIALLHDFQFGLAVILCEMITGKLHVQLIDKHVVTIQKVLLGNNVQEIIIQEKLDKKIVKTIEETQTITVPYHNDNTLKEECRHLLNGIEDGRVETAFGALTNYLDETQKRSMAHLNTVEVVYENDFLQMGFSTKQNLELTSSLRSNSRSQTLWSFLDRYRSSMGSRLLKKWIEYPLVDTAMTNRCLDVVECLNDNFITKDELHEHLGFVYDMERLSARVAYGSANPRDILRLIKTLEYTSRIFESFHGCSAHEEFQSIDPCRELYDMIEGVITDSPPLTLKDGGVFVEGCNEEFNQVREIGKNGKNWILELEDKERERTGVKFLKIGYNRTFGYYVEVTKTNLDSIKDEFGHARKQTLTNVERFITQELKDREDAIVHVQERSIRLEAELFNHLLNQIKVYLPKLHDLSYALATIDVLYALAEISSENGYTRPQFHAGHSIHMKEARHPILDRMAKTTRYVSNNLEVGEGNDILMITGPNMGGKSTYMRQTVFLVIMAQIGCFVPAKRAEMPIFDQIFTRIGASNNIMSGQSTFMVEMIEASNALQNATANLLTLSDEIGRDTPIYDGVALAQVMIEYVMRNIKAKTLFSTHYHELTEMAEKNAGTRSTRVDVYEEDDKVTLLYRVLDGKADKSYGTNVARLTYLPSSVLERVKQILDNLELQPNMVKEVKPPLVIEKENPQHMQIINQVKQVDVNKMTPMEAMQFLYELEGKMSQKRTL